MGIPFSPLQLKCCHLCDQRCPQIGEEDQVIATESRRFQGITTIGMSTDGHREELIVDSAVGTVMNVWTQVVGADVITANGTLVNKIGTAQAALRP